MSNKLGLPFILLGTALIFQAGAAHAQMRSGGNWSGRNNNNGGASTNPFAPQAQQQQYGQQQYAQPQIPQQQYQQRAPQQQYGQQQYGQQQYGQQPYANGYQGRQRFGGGYNYSRGNSFAAPGYGAYEPGYGGGYEGYHWREHRMRERRWRERRFRGGWGW